MAQILRNKKTIVKVIASSVGVVVVIVVIVGIANKLKSVAGLLNPTGNVDVPDAAPFTTSGQVAQISSTNTQQIAELQSQYASLYDSKTNIATLIQDERNAIANIRAGVEYSDAKRVASTAQGTVTTAQNAANSYSAEVTQLADENTYARSQVVTAGDIARKYPNYFNVGKQGASDVDGYKVLFPEWFLFGGGLWDVINPSTAQGNLAAANLAVQDAQGKLSEASTVLNALEQEIAARQAQIAILTTELTTLQPQLDALGRAVKTLGGSVS